jgi:predicted Mrr-cat superfamily restriction endonuclease
VNGNEFVDLVLEHYEKLSSEWKRMLPLRSLYVVDREPEAG